MASLTRVNAQYGVAYGKSDVLVPMPSVSALKPGDFTGNAHSKNMRLQKKERQIRVKGDVKYLWRSNMHAVETDMPVKNPNAGIHARALEELRAAYRADPENFPLDSFKPRLQTRIQQG